MVQKTLSFAEAIARLMPQMDEIYMSYDEQAKEAQTILEEMGETKGCHAGCGACCHFSMIPATAGEAFLLLNHLLANGKTQAELSEIFFSYAKSYLDFSAQQGHLPFSESDQKRFMSLKLPCPLLDKNSPPQPFPMRSSFHGSCSVFRVKPLVCGYYHNLDAPSLCHSKQPHRTFSPWIHAGLESFDRLQSLERSVFGRSCVGHLPLLVAALLTERGLNAFLTPITLPSWGDAQEVLDFQLYVDLLESIGWIFTDTDYNELLQAQKAQEALPNPNLDDVFDDDVFDDDDSDDGDSDDGDGGDFDND